MVGEHPATPPSQKLPEKVTVSEVERPVELSADTISAINSPPDSTHAKDAEIVLKTAGQRRINILWETTQSYIAVLVVTVTVGVAAYQALHPGTDDFPDILTLLAGVVVGNYFARTNHAAIGGVGSKPTEQPYEGR